MRTDETRSNPLAHRPVVKITLRTGQDPALHQTFHLPAELVLFTPEGVLLEPENEAPFSPGEFLALLPRESAAEVLARPGVEGMKLPLGPVGWSRWIAYRLVLKAGARVAPYFMDEASATAGWRLEDPPELPVAMASVLPVYVGKWPRLQLNRPAEFEDAVIEVTRRGGPRHVFRIGLNGVLVRTEGSNVWLDLGDQSRVA